MKYLDDPSNASSKHRDYIELWLFFPILTFNRIMANDIRRLISVSEIYAIFKCIFNQELYLIALRLEVL